MVLQIRIEPNVVEMATFSKTSLKLMFIQFSLKTIVLSLSVSLKKTYIFFKTYILKGLYT